MATTFLFELGVEEIPAGYLAPYGEQLARLFNEELQKAHLTAGTLTVRYTPRRLVLHCAGLAEQQPVVRNELKGPPLDVAYANGAPTRAAQAFAEKAGVSLEQLERREVNGKTYLFATVTRGGQHARELLPEMMPGIIRRLKSPKSMRWADSPTVFARPIRWMLALLGGEVLRITLDGLVSGDVTYGHRFLTPRALRIRSASLTSFAARLRKAHVILDAAEREESIVQQLLAHGAHAEKIDRGLVRACANLVEWPSVVRGAFAPALLALPEPVLMTALKKHQKSFCVYDADGKLAPGFLAVANNDLADEERIRSGYERVVAARLVDAKFFWDEDRRQRLSDRVDALKKVVFQEKLGTYFDKTQRVQALAATVCEQAGWDAARAAACRAAQLSRADLTTAMVFEFPELQGIMGRAYAQVVDGEPDAIALAIEEMYQPRGADDALPASPAGAALSVADKLDSIVGCCAVGLGPTGSADPYALRRQALGVLRIVVAHDMRVSLQALVDRALAQYPQADAPAVRAQVLQLLRGRFETILRDAGVRYDIVDAVLASPGWEHVARSHHTAQQLMQCLPHDAFRRACTVVERCHNITRDAAFEVSAVDATRFVDAREETVWSAWQRARTALQQAISGNDVHGAVTVLAGELHTALHCFFDDVRVNVDDAGLRTNRLRLLRTIRDVIVAEFADLSKIVFEHTP